MKKAAIADQVLQRQDKDGMLRRALERIIQLYTDKSHFVYELLQNAEDAGATRIKFEQYADRLVVLHDGHPFSTENLQGLCDIGKSDKINDLNQIGEFGVGFKSVFGICENVMLYSHPSKADLEQGYQTFAVKIKDFTHPIDIDDDDVESGYTTKFVFPYSVGFTFSGFQDVDKLNDVLSKRLRNLGITTLLFMKNLQSIDYEINLPKLKTDGSYLLDKEAINDHCALVSAVGETGSKKESEEISYLVFSRKVTGIQAGRTIDIAFAVSVDKDGKYNYKPAKSPYISVYFPTETESKLKFIVQGPFRTTPNRSSVPADDADNLDLAGQTASLLRDSVIELRDAGKLDFSFLNILPVDDGEFYSAPLFECMFEETEEMMMDEALLLCKDGTYAAADSVKIARGEKFAEVLSDDLLTELLDDGTEYHWLPTFLTETNKAYKTLYDFLTGVLNIEVIRPENLWRPLNANPAFMPNRDDEWLVEFYNMYASVGAAFSKQRGGTNMLTAQFVKTSKGTFEAPFRKSDGSNQNSFYYRGYENATYLPNVFLPSKNTDTMDDISFVDEKILNRCRNFFTEILNLQKPNEYEFFIQDFKKRYEGGQAVSDDQHITDFKKLMHYYKNGDYREEVANLAKKYLKIRCIKEGKKVYINPNQEKVYFSLTSEDMSIEQYYKYVKTNLYVDIDFYAVEDIDYDALKLLGVSDNIAVKENVTGGEYYSGNPGRQPDWYTYGNFRWKLNLDKLEPVLEYIEKYPDSPNSMAKSSFIFRFLQLNEAKLHGSVQIGGSVPNKPNEYSDIVTTLRRDGASYKYYGSVWGGKWLYTKSGELVSQKEISKRDLNTSLYGEIKPESALYDYLGFLKNEADQLEEAAKEYDELSAEKKDQYFEIELMRRYGISTADLYNSFGAAGADNSQNGGYGTHYSRQEETYEFPSASVKNWDSLRKHAAEVLCYASPVKYEFVVRRIRTSKPVSEVQAYMKGMYRVSGTHEYACQMCHCVIPNVEMAQIANDPDLELDPMHLCLCPNCHTEYKKIRTSTYKMDRFLKDITSLTETEISTNDPVVIELDGEEIWFTQTHAAEIKELIALKKEADSEKKTQASVSKPEHKKNQAEQDATEKYDEPEEPVAAGTDVYKEYIGKRIYHTGKKMYGTVKTCDDKYLGIAFESGLDAGVVKNFSLQMCISNGLIRIV